MGMTPPMRSDDATTRDAFECWARETFVLNWDPEDGAYINTHTDAAWQAWCASKVRERATLAAEVERLKKIEMDREMVNGCLQMIREDLVALMEEPLDCTPDMMLNDALRECVRRERAKVATARADALREVREKVEKLDAYYTEQTSNAALVLYGEVVDILDATRGEA